MPERVLVALGGNALVKAGQRGTLDEQTATLRSALTGVVELIRRGHRVVLTHGNGPQVGQILLRAEAARGQAYDLPLDVCVAQSQGETGYLIQQCLQNLLRQRGIGDHPAATVITRTLVDPDDPRMGHPTKPVGPFYTQEQAERWRATGWRIAEDAHRGYRRLVPSPLPIGIVEASIVRRLVEAGVIVIAGGGGGIPVRRERDGTLAGVEAVVDKDLASSRLAVELGIDTSLDLTAVEQVMLDFGTTKERPLGTLTVQEARTYLAEGHFAPGSMGPKIEAAMWFLERGGREIIITSPEKALAAFDGSAGTHLYPAPGGKTRKQRPPFKNLPKRQAKKFAGLKQANERERIVGKKTKSRSPGR
ncbi:MAG: carbamate kinase [Nitrospirota bacterium]|nr:carbamate kinase [Nitrospirota bacterium]